MKPGSVLQFGAGNFLRAFVDLFLCQMPGRTRAGEVTVVQSTGRGRADALNAAGGRYPVAIQGKSGHQVIDEVAWVDSISRAVVADEEWDAVLAAAVDPDLQWVVSNVTEAGLALDPADTAPGRPPVSYPAKLLAVLDARRRAGLPGPHILPCELVENNGQRLRALVLEQAARWQLDPATVDWLAGECAWADTLVDRIVPGRPASHPMLADHPMFITTEPFAFWAVASPRPMDFPHPAVVETSDLAPWFLRKVRLLNGAHTALAARALPMGFTTVGECLADPAMRAWLEDLLFNEIVPVIAGRVEDAAGFARDTLDRFANPFHAHKLSDIALHHATKLETRLRPSLEDYRRLFGKEPPVLSKILDA